MSTRLLTTLSYLLLAALIALALGTILSPRSSLSSSSTSPVDTSEADLIDDDSDRAGASSHCWSNQASHTTTTPCLSAGRGRF